MVKKVASVRFSTFTEADRENLAVVECTQVAKYNADGTPKDRGVMSLYMGVTSGRTFCRTCKNNQEKCPGHFGIIRFARPVYAALWFTTRTVPVLGMLCFFCSKLRLNLDKVPPDKLRGKRHEIFKELRKPKYLRKGPCPGCGMTVQPKFVRCGQNIATEWPDDMVFESDEHREFCTRPFTTARARQILEHVHGDEAHTYLQMKNLADMMVPKSMLVLPVTGRAPSVVKNIKTEHDITQQSAVIVKHNEGLKKLDARIAAKVQEIKEAARDGNARDGNARALDLAKLRTEADEVFHDLQQAFNVYQVKDFAGGKTNRSRRRKRSNHMKKVASRSDELSSKDGLFRKYLCAGRVNDSGRSVIVCDACIKPFEVGVPWVLAKELTKPKTVNDLNIRDLRESIVRGTEARGGAHAVERTANYTVSLRGLTEEERRSVAEQLEIGMTVHRTLRDGDWVLINRQPSLHK